jgi:hypothetical protein
VLIGLGADNGDMTALLLLIVPAAFVGLGVLAVRDGADSRQTDPRDVRASWL